jgi:hypothetical protein
MVFPGSPIGYHAVARDHLRNAFLDFSPLSWHKLPNLADQFSFLGFLLGFFPLLLEQCLNL